MKAFHRLLSYLRNRKGQTIIEYVLVIVLISLVLILAFRGGDVQFGVEHGSWQIGNALAPGATEPTR